MPRQTVRCVELCSWLALVFPLQNNCTWTVISYRTLTPPAASQDWGLTALQKVISIYDTTRPLNSRELNIIQTRTNEPDTMQRKPFPFPLLPVPCPPYRRRYIFHGSESFSWTSAFTALPKYCVGSPAPAWLPSPSALMFSRLPRLALVLDIWNKNRDTASSPARSCGHCQSGRPQDGPVESCFFKERSQEVCTGCLNCISKA